MSRRAALATLLCAIVGFGSSVAAATTHYHLFSDPTYRSFCDVSERISCTQVYLSRYSVLGGIPVAVFGALWFTVVGLLSLAGLRARDAVRENVPGYLFALSTVGLAVVLYLGYASFFIIKAVCILCLTTYAAVIGLFLISGAGVSFPMTSLPRRAARDARILTSSPAALTFFLLFVTGAASTLAFFPRASVSASGDPVAPAPTQDQRSEFERWYVAQPRTPLVIPADGAKVLIVKFNDFQCPACGQTYSQYKPILAKYQALNPGAVKFVLKDYPLNRDCNEGLAQTIHPAACEAAVAVRLAPPARVEALEDWLYGHQPMMTPASVRQAARDVAGITDFETRYATTLAMVKGDAGLGRQLGVRSTPTFFVNGVKLEGGFAPQYFDQAIAYELKR